MEQTEGRAEWISTSSPSQCPGEAAPSSCPSESLSLQGPRELLFIHLLLLLVDAGVGNGISPVERRDSVGMAEIWPSWGLALHAKGFQEGNQTCWPSAPELGPSTQQLQKEEWDPQDNLVWIPKSSELQQPPGPSLPGL